MRINKSMKEGGFSLVELMVVVAIIGVLAALAVPRFQTFQAKARQSEAKGNLSHIYTLETSYYGDNDTYVDFADIGKGATCGGTNVIGFSPQPCSKVRYLYKVTGSSTAVFTGEAHAAAADIVPNCTGYAGEDKWQINETKLLASVAGADAVQQCK